MSNLSHYTRHQTTQADAMAVLAVLGQGPLTQGPMVELFEEALKSATGAPHAVVVNSGTAALHLAYGLVYERGQTLSMPPLSFVATANAALYNGLRVSWKECSPRTGLVMEDCDVGVELGGQPTGHRHTIVDACHSVRYVPEALVTVLSFHPAKHIACGEGGALLTGDATIAERARLLRSHGREGTQMTTLGFNYRMSDLNAALGLGQITHVWARIAQRKALAALYDTAFDGSEAILPVPHNAESHRHLYQVKVQDRDRVAAALKAKGIGTAVHYPLICDQPYYIARGMQPDLGLGWARDFARNVLSLPLFPQMTPEDVQTVATTLQEVV